VACACCAQDACAALPHGERCQPADWGGARRAPFPSTPPSQQDVFYARSIHFEQRFHASFSLLAAGGAGEGAAAAVPRPAPRVVPTSAVAAGRQAALERRVEELEQREAQLLTLLPQQARGVQARCTLCAPALSSASCVRSAARAAAA
jgi:hypothetical protein